MADKVLDARHLNCPIPILKTKRALSEVSPGGILEVLATDPGSPADFEAFAEARKEHVFDVLYNGLQVRGGDS